MAEPIKVSHIEAIELVKSRRNSAWHASLSDFQRFGTYYNLFRNRQTTKNYVGLANLFIPEPYRIIRKKTAKLARAIRKVEVTPQDGPEDKAGARVGTHLLNFIRRKLNWKVIERSAIQESRITGLAWFKLLWSLDREEEDRPYMGFDLTFHSADEILLPEGTTLLDFLAGKSKYLIHEYEADFEELKKNKGYSQTSLAILKLRAGGAKTEFSSLEQSRNLYKQDSKNSDKQTKKFKVNEYWGKFQDVVGGDEKDYLIVIADSDQLLRITENPYKEILDIPIPFVPLPANLVGKELYPIGDLESGESLFNELNDTRNQRMDTVTMNIDPPKEILKGANIKREDLVVKRGWMWESSIPNGVRFIPPDLQGVRAAIEEEKAIRGDIQQYSGVLDFSPGTDVQAGVSIDTARGSVIAKGEADEITEDDLEILKMSLRMLYRIALVYAQNLLDRAFVIRIVENGAESFVNASRDAIKGNYDLDIVMKTLQDITTEQQLSILLFNQAKTVPGAKVGKFFIDMLEKFKEEVDINEYYQEPQPVEEKPKISISLRGELNPVEVDEIYKLTGADPKAADPLLRQELREAMRGNLPEFQQGVAQQGIPVESETGTQNV